MNTKYNKAKLQNNYIKVLNYLVSKTFRYPMKKFFDDNCGTFEDKLENTHEHFKLHEQFKDIIETLLSVMISEIGISQEEFIEIAKLGLERDNDKPYFEQVISCDNFEWFKNVMVKRNLQLKQLSYNYLYANDGKLQLTKDSTINKMLKDKEQAELECALQMSVVAEEEKKKLYGNMADDELAVSYIKILGSN